MFMTTLVEDMVARSLIVQREGRWNLSKSTDEIRTWIPGTLEQMLRLQFEQLGEDEKAVLTSGSVVGEPPLRVNDQSKFHPLDALVDKGTDREAAPVKECSPFRGFKPLRFRNSIAGTTGSGVARRGRHLC